MLDFIITDGHKYVHVSTRGDFFSDFGSRLRFGTIDQGEDPSGLWWLPRRKSERHLQNAKAFGDWCKADHISKEVGTVPSLPLETRIACWRMWDTSTVGQKQNPQMNSRNPADVRSSIYPLRTQRVSYDVSSPPFLSDDNFKTLLFKGFRTPGSLPTQPIWLKYNIRDVLYAILLHGAGLRISEPCHIFADDIVIDPQNEGIVQVRLYHPEDGLVAYRDPVTGSVVKTSRIAYLKMKHDRLPLTMVGKRSGFKPKRYPRFLPAFWFPSVWGRIFTYFLKIYLEQCRPKSALPWLFLTINGLPLTAKAYAERHRDAMQRAGIEVAKELGTTPHGHRHAYGQRLERARERGYIDKKTIMICLRQTNPDSQEIYTLPTVSMVSDELKRADTRLFDDRLSVEKFVKDFGSQL